MLFRDYLRQHEEVATEYAVLKRRLADQFPYDGDRYTSEKSAFISDIVGRALKESWEDVTSGVTGVPIPHCPRRPDSVIAFPWTSNGSFSMESTIGVSHNQEVWT